MSEDAVRERLERLHMDAQMADIRGYNHVQDLYELEWARAFRELVAVRVSVTCWRPDPLKGVENGAVSFGVITVTEEELEQLRNILERGRVRARLARGLQVEQEAHDAGA